CSSAPVVLWRAGRVGPATAFSRLEPEEIDGEKPNGPGAHRRRPGRGAASPRSAVAPALLDPSPRVRGGALQNSPGRVRPLRRRGGGFGSPRIAKIPARFGGLSGVKL